ncbi:MAG: hypothetical protein LQ346_007837 [Caloplaca aetnensis]|nr:MAG: hypothetical protein LQ346_007837 [Caloplaca aetnensis]
MADADGTRTFLWAAVHAPHDLLIPLVLHDEHASPPNSAKKHEPYEPSENPTTAKKPKPKPKPPKTAAEKEEDAKKEAEGAKGHIVFAAARNLPHDTTGVETLIMDSYPGIISRARIERSAARTVSEIGWRAMNTNGTAPKLATEPTFTHQDVAVPHQEGFNTCGMYTIFNAWVYMLHLPPLNRRARYYPGGGGRRPGLDASMFLNDGRAMINLALRGRMDYRTIQAFFNYYGYCELQDPDDAGIALSAGARTSFMTEAELLRVLDMRREVEVSQLAGVGEVMARANCSREEAQGSLELAGGDVDVAVFLYLERGTSS